MASQNTLLEVAVAQGDCKAGPWSKTAKALCTVS